MLSNMKGIIARFDTVDIPDQKIVSRGGQPDSCVVRSRIVVWTSEGKTIQPLLVRIHPNVNYEDMPKGFVDCDAPNRGQAGPPDQPPGTAETAARGDEED